MNAALLTSDHNRNRVTTSKDYLALFNHKSNELFHRFLNVDGIWILPNTSEINSGQNEGTKKSQRRPSFDNLEKERRINYDSNVMDRIKDDLRKNNHMRTRKNCLIPRQYKKAHALSRYSHLLN